MKGKFSTKTIVIIALTVLLLAIGITGTVLFLKDSGEAAAMEEPNVLPVTGTNNEPESGAETPVNQENLVENGEEQQTEEAPNATANTTGGTTGARNTTPAQSTREITQEPETSTVEREKVIAESKELNWNKFSLTEDVDNLNKNINYNNLKYRVEYYLDGELDENLTETIGKNKKGQTIETYTDKVKAGYGLEKTENLPLIVSELEENNVIKVFYAKQEFRIEKVATLYKSENNKEKVNTRSTTIEKAELGDKIHYLVTVTNTGKVNANGIIVTDTMQQNNVIVDVKVGETKTAFEYDYEVTQDDIDAQKPIYNKAIAKTDNNEQEIETETDIVEADDTVKVTKTSELVKAEGNTVTGKAQVKDQIKYAVTVKNTGNVTLEKVTINDSMLGITDKEEVVNLKPGEETTIELGNYEVKQEDVDNQAKIYNIVTVNETEGKDEGTDIVEKIETVEVTKTSELVKTEGNTVTGKAQVKDQIKYAVTVKNTGNVTLEKVTINDSMLGITDKEEVVNLKPGEETTIELGSYEVKQEDIDNQEKIYNIVTVNGTEGKDEGTDIVEKEETVEVTKTSELVKAEGNTVTGKAQVKDQIKYAVIVKNTGNVTLEKVTINDSMLKITNDEKTVNLKPGEETTIELGNYEVKQEDIDNQEKIYNIVTVNGTEGKDQGIEVVPRNNYIVNYYKENTTDKLAESKSESAYLGTEVIETAKDLRNIGYNLVGTETQKLVIKSGNNEINFYYKARTDVSYTVKYLEKDTGKELAGKEERTGKTFNATYEETAKEITGYTVDAETKSITLDAYNKELVFYYTAKTDVSYTVKYLEKDTENELAGKEERTGKTFNVTYQETAKEITGYTVDAETKSITLDAYNKELIFYYTARTDLSYTVKYLEKDTGKELAGKEERTGKTFNATYEETAKEITGYTVDAETKSITLDAYNKELVFYYTAKTDVSYTVKYLEKDTGKELAGKEKRTGKTFNVTYQETAKEITGYTVDAETKSITLDAYNKELVFYYIAKTDVSYTVKYLEKGTENELAGKEERTGKTFNATYEETAKEITGYTVDAETKSITLDAYNKELIFYYTARTDLSYKINYYYNGNLGKSEEIKEQTYGTIIRIEDIKEKIDSNKKEYEHIETTTAQQPFVSGLLIIGTDLSKNVINVYYGKPEIKAEKTSIITTTADKGKAHVGDVIRYTIKVWNTGKVSKDVTVKDTVPTGTTLVENSTVLSTGTKTVTNNKEIIWNVNIPANTSKENAATITFEVKINQNAEGTKITNTAYIDKTETDDPEKYDVTKPAKIIVSKSADKSGKVLTGEKVTYTLSAINEGDEAGSVVIKDASLKELINNGKLQLIGEIKTSDGKVISLEDLSSGVTITVNGKNVIKTIKYTVEVTANAGEKIKNVVEVIEGGNVKEDKKEVVLEVEKNITATKLTEKKNKKNIIIAIDRSESMRYYSKYKEAKKAVQNIIDIIYPDNDTNNGTNTKVIAYAGVGTCDTIGSANGYSNKEKLKKKVENSLVVGTTNLKYVLKYIADEVPTTEPTNNVVIFVGDGGTGMLAGVKWKDCIENSNKLKAKATVYTIGVQESDVLKNMSTDPNKTYSTVNGYTESGLTEALKKVITDISIESNKSTKKTDNGKVLLEGLYVDAKHPIVITVEGKKSETFNSIPSTIIKEGNNYYLDLTKFNANDRVSITYYSK